MEFRISHYTQPHIHCVVGRCDLCRGCDLVGVQSACSATTSPLPFVALWTSCRLATLLQAPLQHAHGCKGEEGAHGGKMYSEVLRDDAAKGQKVDWNPKAPREAHAAPELIAIRVDRRAGHEPRRPPRGAIHAAERLANDVIRRDEEPR